MLGLAIPRRAALFAICVADSSPATYTTFPSTLLANCKSSVDLPMPGSPATSVTIPETIPPPKTRSSSVIFVEVRCPCVSFLIEVNCTSSAFLPCALRTVRFVLVEITVSTIEFHVPQLGHFPTHLGVTNPQFWQTY